MHEPTGCNCQNNLAGLSAAEVPDPSIAPPDRIYQAFGVGGRWVTEPIDGSQLLGSRVIIPHYAGMVSELTPQESIAMWHWLIEEAGFSPLNNIESLMFESGSDCESNYLKVNMLKGSWNLLLQSLGWGRYLVGKSSQEPNIWEATSDNKFLHSGYNRLVSHYEWLAPVFHDSSHFLPLLPCPKILTKNSHLNICPQ